VCAGIDDVPDSSTTQNAQNPLYAEVFNFTVTVPCACTNTFSMATSVRVNPSHLEFEKNCGLATYNCTTLALSMAPVLVTVTETLSPLSRVAAGTMVLGSELFTQDIVQVV